MTKIVLFCCAAGLIVAGCKSKSDATPATETSPITGMPANTSVLSANAHPGDAPVVATTTAATMPAPEASAHGITYSGVQLESGIASACNIPAPKAYFEYDSANIKGSDMGPLDALATCLSSGALKGKTIEIIGHTDERGDADYNKQLGYSRSQSVANYLATKGLDKSKVITMSKGQQGATTNAHDPNAMAHDRRVDIQLKK